MSNQIESYKCDICNKNYKSYKSKWNHNKQFHKNPEQNISNTSSLNQITPIVNTSNIKIICKYCDKSLSRLDNLARHEKICKIKKQYIDKENKIKELEYELEELKEILKHQ